MPPLSFSMPFHFSSMLMLSPRHDAITPPLMPLRCLRFHFAFAADFLRHLMREKCIFGFHAYAHFAMLFSPLRRARRFHADCVDITLRCRFFCCYDFSAFAICYFAFAISPLFTPHFTPPCHF